MKPGRAVAFAALAALSLVPCGAGRGLRAQVFVGPRATAIPITNPLDTVTVPIVADVTGAGGATLGSITAQLSWRAGTLRFLGAGAGAAGVPVINVDSANGTVRFALAMAGGVSGLPVLMQARFQAIGPLGDSTTLAVSVSELTAAGTFAALTPATTAALVCIGAVAGRWGDLTGDDLVMSNDALAIVTYAVGLPIAPLTPINGDVDGDGAVNTRDALIVLSFVVGLPVPGFRVNQLRPSACGSGSPVAGVAVTPGTASLVTGDQLPLAITVVDTGGAIVHANPAWLTRDAAVATVDRAGVVQAVGAGTTRIVVAAVPGIMDSTTVTVGGTRRVWYVDAASAGAVHNGSPQFPFETLQAAVDAAATDDSILVAAGDYGLGADATVPLTIMGNPSTARPRIRGPIAFTGIAGTVKLTRLIVGDAASGIEVQGVSGAGQVFLDSVTVERSRGPGIGAFDLSMLSLVNSAVVGAFGEGIITAAVADVQLSGVTVDAVAGAAPGTVGKTLDLSGSSVVNIASSAFYGAPARLTSPGDVTVFATRFADSPEGLLVIRGGGVVTLDSVEVLRPGVKVGEAGLDIEVGQGNQVTVTRTTIRDGEGVGLAVRNAGVFAFNVGEVRRGVGAVPSLPAVRLVNVEDARLTQVTVDNGRVTSFDSLGVVRSFVVSSAMFRNAPLSVTAADSVTMRNAGFLGGVSPLVQVLGTPLVVFGPLEAANATLTAPAVLVTGGDSLRVDSLWAHDNDGPGVTVSGFRAMTSTGARFERNQRTTIQRTLSLLSVNTARVAQALFDEVATGAVSVLWGPNVAGTSLVIDTVEFRGSQVAINVVQNVLASTVLVRQSRLERGSSIGGSLVLGTQRGRVRVEGSQVDSVAQSASAVIDVSTDTIEVVNSQFRGVPTGIDVVPIAGPLRFTVTGNTVECYPVYFVVSAGFQAQDGEGLIDGNTIRRCAAGVAVRSDAAGRAVTVTANTITDLDTSYGSAGVHLLGGWLRPVVTQNLVERGLMPGGGIYLQDNGFAIDSARVDSNLVRDGRGPGIRVTFGVRGATLRGNTVERMRQAFTSSEAAIWVDGGQTSPDTTRLLANRLQQNRVFGFHVGTGAPVRLDSNVVVDDSLQALRINAAALVGRFNFFARNAEGIFGNGTITIDQSVIQQSTTVGARFSSGTFNLANNFWGDATGPRCGGQCLGALGDSIVGAVTFQPFLAAPPTTPTGAPPLRPVAAAAATAPRITARVVEPAWFAARRPAPRPAPGGSR